MFSDDFKVRKMGLLKSSDAIALRLSVSRWLPEDMADVFDAVWPAKAAVETCAYADDKGFHCTLYFLGDVPMVFDVTCMPQFFTWRCIPHTNVIGRTWRIPTIFFFMRCRAAAASLGKLPLRLTSSCGVHVYCHGMISPYIIKGAHVMMSGIVSLTCGDACETDVLHRNSGSTDATPSGKSMKEADVALVFSVGVDVPYAVGLLTQQAVHGAAKGIGVGVLHCYRDNLWRTYKAKDMTLFRARTLSECIPAAFSEDAVMAPPCVTDATGSVTNDSHEHSAEGVTSMAAQTADDGNAGVKRHVDATSDTPDELRAAHEGDGCVDERHTQGAVADKVSGEVDAPTEEILQFALCETLKSVTPSRLPMPLLTFTSIFLQKYPRGVISGEKMSFKRTQYKTALRYFRLHEDVVTICEVAPGVHEVTNIARPVAMMREHALRHAEWIATLPYDEAMLGSEAACIDTKEGGALYRRVVSVAQVYKPTDRVTDELAYVLLLGRVTDTDNRDGRTGDGGVSVDRKYTTAFPTLAEMQTSGERKDSVGHEPKCTQPPTCELLEELDKAYNATYEERTIAERVRRYITSRRLFVHDGKGSGVPKVRLDGALSVFRKKGQGDDELLPINEVVYRTLRLFALWHRIIVRSSTTAAELDAGGGYEECIEGKGALPNIEVQKVKRNGSAVTLVHNVLDYGLDLDATCAILRRHFLTGGTLVHSVHFKKSKRHTYTDEEDSIMLQGNLTAKVKSVLEKTFGIPHGYIS